MQVDVCKDEVLLNTVLDACIHLKELDSMVQPQICSSQLGCIRVILTRCTLRCGKPGQDNRRLQTVLRQFERTTIKPSVQNYGLVIKAYACLKQTKRCWAVWNEMTEKRQRGLTPSDVALSCMLDALVSSGQVDEAVGLFDRWRTVVPPNTIIFSNLIKGFAAQGDAERAMDMFGA